MVKQGRTSCGAVAQTLHWPTAVLVLVAFVWGPGGSELRVHLPQRDFERQLHETLGLCVFALLFVRVLWRLVDARPDAPPSPRWMALAAKAMQGFLYLLLVAVPATAIAGAWLEGHPRTLLAGLEIAPRVAAAHDLGVRIAEINTWLGDTLLWLAGAHALAALHHHVVARDGVLLSMLPSWFPAGRAGNT